jgi:hypothetical protein
MLFKERYYFHWLGVSFYCLMETRGMLRLTIAYCIHKISPAGIDRVNTQMCYPQASE